MCGRRAKTLRRLGVTILASLSNLGAAMALYSAFIYVAAVLMVQFQAGKLRYAGPNRSLLHLYQVSFTSC
jgi:hypothetical protein